MKTFERILGLTAATKAPANFDKTLHTNIITFKN